MQKLTVGVASNAAAPTNWLDACAKMMNTAINLILDHVSRGPNQTAIIT